MGFDFFSLNPEMLANLPFYIFPPKNILNTVASHLWKFYGDHQWMLIFHSFGDLPPAIAPLLNFRHKLVKLESEITVVPAEKKLIIENDIHWGFKNRKPAQTFAFVKL